MQGYDFLKLYQDYGVVLELGGDDQWSNMLAGANLIRKKEEDKAIINGEMFPDKIRNREEISEQIKALLELKEMFLRASGVSFYILLAFFGCSLRRT